MVSRIVEAVSLITVGGVSGGSGKNGLQRAAECSLAATIQRKVLGNRVVDLSKKGVSDHV